MLDGVIEDISEGPDGYRPEMFQVAVRDAIRAGGRGVFGEFYC